MDLRIDAVLIETCRPEELAAFYQRVFDLPPPRPSGDDHVGFTLANTYLGFERSLDETDSAARPVSIWFAVDDVDRTFARLVEEGCRVKYAPTGEESPGEILAVALDPDGNQVGLIGPDPTARS